MTGTYSNSPIEVGRTIKGEYYFMADLSKNISRSAGANAFKKAKKKNKAARASRKRNR